MFNLGELLDADEIFISGTTKFIVPVIKINEKNFYRKTWFSYSKIKKRIDRISFTKENEFTEKVYDEKTIRTIGNEKI